MSHRRHPIWKVLVLMGADICVIALALAAAYAFRFRSGLIPLRGEYDQAQYLDLFPWAVGLWFVSLRFENIYRRRSKIFDFNVVRRIVTASILAMLFIFAFIVLRRLITEFSRVLIPITFAFVVLFLVAERIALHLVYRRLAVRRHLGLTRTLIVGQGALAARVFDALRRHPEHGMAPIGVVYDPTLGEPDGAASELPVLGTIDELERVLEAHRIEEVVLAQPELDREKIPRVLVQTERHMASFRIIPDTAELLMSGMSVEMLNGIPFLGARSSPLQGWNAALKRMIDFAAALGGLIALSPLFGVVAWLIRREDGGEILYTQERMGIDGRQFKIVKFRTMRPDAEKLSGPIFADDDDPRCTRVGGRLRKYRIDEFPQLVNVLRGHMSLVGPRPERPHFIDQFREDIPQYMTRHKVKSGITGWAQINGLSGKHGSIAERLEYDLYYIENWSIWLDVKILFLTFFSSSSRAA